MKLSLNNIFIKVKHHKTILQNFSYLSVIQIINLLITLATYPYLIRVLGRELFGLVVYAQAIISYLTVLVSFGFNLSATKEVSINRNNLDKLSEIFSSVIILKGILFIASFGILVIILLLVPEAKDHKLLFLFSMFACFYEFIYPSWYFQGTEKMKFVTLITLTSKFIFLFLVFIFIDSKDDYLLVPLFNGAGSIIAGTISIYIVIANEKLRFSFQPFRKLWYHLHESTAYFISNVSIQLYANANKIIIGSFLGMTEVAYYDIAEKVVLLLKLPNAILTQTIFPKISKSFNLNFLRKVFYYSTSGNFLLLIIVFFLAPIIIVLLGSKEMLESSNILRLFALTVPLNGISSFLSVQILIPLGFKKFSTKAIVSSVIFYMLLVLVLIFLKQITIYYVIMATILTELYIIVVLYLMCNKRNLLWNSNK